VERVLDAVGLSAADAQQFDVSGEPVIAVRLHGDAQQVWRRARTALSDRYPVLVMDDVQMAVDRVIVDNHRPPRSPAEMLAAASTIDVDASIAELSRGPDGWDLGAADDDYGSLDDYDVRHYGTPNYLVILPRPEPWAAYAYVESACLVSGRPPELLIAAAHRWHDRYGAEPTVAGIAMGFTVARPPADVADAERLAAEHMFFAALTANGVRLRAYARALLQLDRWTLFERP
jgi:hypothetical protein